MFPFFHTLYNHSQVSIVALWATCFKYVKIMMTYKGPMWVPHGLKFLYGTHMGPIWASCLDSAHMGPICPCVLGMCKLAIEANKIDVFHILVCNYVITYGKCNAFISRKPHVQRMNASTRMCLPCVRVECPVSHVGQKTHKYRGNVSTWLKF